MNKLLAFNTFSLLFAIFAWGFQFYEPAQGNTDTQTQIEAEPQYDDQYGLEVTVCAKGECDKYIVDKNFNHTDCIEEAKLRHLDDAPFVSWECIVVDVE